MKSLVVMRSPGLFLRLMALLVALLAICSQNVLGQTRAEADVVKSLINHADEERSLLLEIRSASTVRALAQITDTNFPKSRIGQMLRSLRLFQLNEKEGSLAVLQSLPRSDVEMEALNEFTHEKGNGDFQPMYRAYYESAFQSVVSHPTFLHSIFRISTQFDTKNWPDYDDTDWYCSELAKVRKAVPKEYDHALSRESSRDKNFLSTCGSGH